MTGLLYFLDGLKAEIIYFVIKRHLKKDASENIASLSAIYDIRTSYFPPNIRLVRYIRNWLPDCWLMATQETFLSIKAHLVPTYKAGVSTKSANKGGWFRSRYHFINFLWTHSQIPPAILNNSMSIFKANLLNFLCRKLSLLQSLLEERKTPAFHKESDTETNVNIRYCQFRTTIHLRLPISFNLFYSMQY